MHSGGSPTAKHNIMRQSILARYTQPLERRTPSGLGAFFSSDTLKSIGMSLDEGGLYSYNQQSPIHNAIL